MNSQIEMVLLRALKDAGRVPEKTQPNSDQEERSDDSPT